MRSQLFDLDILKHGGSPARRASSKPRHVDKRASPRAASGRHRGEVGRGVTYSQRQT